MNRDWMNTCQVCGAEESLDMLVARMIDDDTVRRLIHDVLKMSLPLGGLLVRYIRLHKPLKQQLRMTRLRDLLNELAGDMQRGTIERHGRAWAVSHDDWREAFNAVFGAVDKGSLLPPLQGNGYLYQVLTRMCDEAEAAQEAQREQERRTAGRAHSSAAPTHVGQLLTAAGEPGHPGGATLAAPQPAAPAQAPGMSPTVRAMRAAIERKKSEQQ